MRSLTIIISLLLLVVVLSECKKKAKEVEFNGKVIDAATSQAIGGAQVTLASTSVQSWVYNSNFQDIATTVTAADGSFSFVFDDMPASAYRVYIYKNLYFENITVINASDISDSKVYYDNFPLHAESTLTLHVQNLSAKDEEDEEERIVYKIVNGALNCTGCCPSNYMYGYGTDYDTTFTCKTYGNTFFVVESIITKGGSIYQRLDSTYVEPFQNNLLEILY